MEESDRYIASLTEDGRYRLLVEGITDYAIFMLDPTGVVSSWNAGVQRFKGYEASEIIGQHFSRFYTEGDQKIGLPQRALQTAAQEGKFETEGWRIRKDGSRFWAHIVIDPIRDPTGSIVGFSKITRDLTDRRKSQEELEKTREALVQSQKLDAIGQLTGGIAHDFNNLLTAILSSLELLRKQLPENPKIMGLLENATQGVVRGSMLTKRLLAFARRQDLRAEAVDIAELVHGMTDLLHRSLGPSILIETRFPLALTPAQVDPNQLEMAVLNLCLNARDAMPNGGEIIIAAREQSSGSKPGKYICLTITDAGEGMDEATLKRAIDPFFTTKGLGKGTGLGLPMVHGLAEQSGGRFILKSQKGKGTTAELLLPAATKAITKTGQDLQSTHQTEQDIRPLVVLAVDDDPLVLWNTLAMLEDLGHTALEANSGKEALNILRGENSVDLVITDQAMPYMTGAELAEAIKCEWPNLPIILATGYAELPSAVKTSFQKISKPFTQRDLAEALAGAKLKGHDTGRVVRNSCR